MEYFELFQSKGVVKAIQILNLDKKEYTYQLNGDRFHALAKLKVGYYSGFFDEEPCDILKEPTFMVSDITKKLFALYEPEIEWKAIQIFPLSDACMDHPLYWVPYFPALECLHPTAKIYTNGMVERLVLAAEHCAQRSIFRVEGLLEYKVVISLPVAESLLRRRLYGIGLKKVEVR